MYTSKNTSVNSTRPAAIYSYVGFDMDGKHVLDYGCGRYTEVCKKAAYSYYAATWTGYDPYWKPQSLKYRVFDIVLCANVLNVIREKRELDACIESCLRMVDVGGKAVFQIYEGDRTGEGRETKPDCWQRNERTQAYADRIYLSKAFEPCGMSIKVYKNYIVVTDEAPF